MPARKEPNPAEDEHADYQHSIADLKSLTAAVAQVAGRAALSFARREQMELDVEAVLEKLEVSFGAFVFTASYGTARKMLSTSGGTLAMALAFRRIPRQALRLGWMQLWCSRHRAARWLST